MCSLARDQCAQLGANVLVVHGGPVLKGYDMVEYFNQPVGSRNATMGREGSCRRTLCGVALFGGR